MRRFAAASFLLLLMIPPESSRGKGPTLTDKPMAFKVQIEGYVLDSHGDGLSGVDVSVWTAGKSDALSSTKTDKDGKYSLQFTASEAFDVAYTITGYRQAVFAYLAERKDQKISRVLYSGKEGMPITAAHAYLQSLDRIAFLAVALPKESRKEFLGSLKSPLDTFSADEWKGDKGPLLSGTSSEVRTYLGEEASFVSDRLRRVLSTK